MRKINKVLKCAIILALAVMTGATCLASGTGWGLSYPEPGKAPKGNVSAGELLKHDAYFIGDENSKTVYLTFDAGYENGHTGEILDVLKKAGVPAAFFLVGTYIRDNPELVTRMVGEGHIVANHTMSHPDMSKISDIDSFKKELTQTEELYKQLTGTEMPKYYRPPRGIYSAENLKMAKELGYKTIFWSLAYVDWNTDKQPTREEACSKLVPRAHNGMVLLLHSTSKTNAEIMEELIAKYMEMGYEFGDLDTLCAKSS